VRSDSPEAIPGCSCVELTSSQTNSISRGSDGRSVARPRTWTISWKAHYRCISGLSAWAASWRMWRSIGRTNRVIGSHYRDTQRAVVLYFMYYSLGRHWSPASRIMCGDSMRLWHCSTVRTPPRSVIAFAIALMVAFATSCDSGPTAPSTVDVGGSWNGTTCPPSFYDSCVIHFTISQVGQSLSGMYGTTSEHGTLTGSMAGSNVSMSMTPSYSPPACTRNVSASVKGNQMTGTITSSCFAGISQISLSRERQ
jgi:hypothetical protein